MNTRFLTTIAVLLLAPRMPSGPVVARAQIETNIHSFVGYPTDGSNPFAGLVQGGDGNFYGTTGTGGTSTNCGPYGCGTVFRISPSGVVTTLYSGAGPYASGGNTLVQGNDGNFYGTTLLGGTYLSGSVFRISPSGTYTTLYSFTSIPDGAEVNAGLVQGRDGNFYGTTSYGGVNGFGTIFRISPSGSYTSLYSFANLPDGAAPQGALAQGSDGNFYGTTQNGGTSTNCDGNCGTVFRISPGGSYTSLYSFVSYPTDGALPSAGLVQGSDGNFYGTTQNGGTNDFGTVFRISPSGSETNLHSLVGSPHDGANPYAGLVQGSDGNFYGTAPAGGTNFQGTVFRISPSGSYTTLYAFAYAPDGSYPQAGLVQGSDGSFYGTTAYGGMISSGTVFRLTVPLNPPPNQINSVHLAVTNIIFTIPSIAGETYQLQFSGSMKPTNWVNVSGVSVTNSIGALLTVTNFGGAVGPQGFYRFDITP